MALASPMSRIQTEVRELRNSMFIAFGAAIIIGIMMSFVFANYQTRRINKLRKRRIRFRKGTLMLNFRSKVVTSLTT